MIPDSFSRTDSLLHDNDPEAHRQFVRWVGYNASELHAEMFNGTMRKMGRHECAERYKKDYNTEGGTVVVVTNTTQLFDRHAKSLVPSTREQISLQYSWMYESNHDQEELLAKTSDSDPGRPDWTLVGSWWNYPRWNFTAPTEDGSLRQFDLGPTYTGFYMSILDRGLRSDLRKLYWFIVERNPNPSQLSQMLSAPETWSNSTWARHTRAQVGNSTGREMLSALTWLDVPQPSPDGRFHVSHCLSKDAKQRCQVLFSLPIALVVLACNSIKVVCMFLAAKSVHRRDVLLTVGDAVASFLTRPDLTTRGRCLLSRSDIEHETEIWTTVLDRGPNQEGLALDDFSIPAIQIPTSYPQRLSPSRQRWYRASSPLYWACFVTLYGSHALPVKILVD